MCAMDRALWLRFRKLDKLFLNLLQPFLPLDMGDLRLCSVLDPKAIPIVQRLDVRNLRPKTRNLFPKDFNVIHGLRIAHLSARRVGRARCFHSP